MTAIGNGLNGQFLRVYFGMRGGGIFKEIAV